MILISAKKIQSLVGWNWAEFLWQGIGSFFVNVFLHFYCKFPKVPSSNGTLYAALSDTLWGSSNEYSHRILFPFVSYLIGLHGDRIAWACSVFTWISIFMLLRYMTSLDVKYKFWKMFALLMTFPFLFTLYWPGYPEAFCIMLIVSIFFTFSPAIIASIFFAGLLSNEMIIISMPFFLWRNYRIERSGKALLEMTKYLGFSFGLYLIYRIVIVKVLNPAYGGSFYFQPMKKNILYWWEQSHMYLPLALIGVFAFLWIPLIWSFFSNIKKSDYSLLFAFSVSLIIALLMIFIGAIDSTRILIYLAPYFIWCVVNERVFQKEFVWKWIALISFFLPKVYITGKTLVFLWPFFSYQL